MIRPKLVVVNNEREEQPRAFLDGRGFRFDLSRNKLIFYSLSFVLSLCFMFTLGICVGRGVSMVKPDDFSIKGRFLKFLGLENQTGRSSPGAAATWEDPRKMLESLNYYEDLTHKGGMPQDRRPSGQPFAPAPKANELPAAIPAPEPAKELPKRSPALRSGGTGPAEKLSAPQSDKLKTAGNSGGQYTLLVASLKEPDAQVLIEKLKTRGYSPRVESLDLGSAKWNRILLGSFPSREAAIVYADEFNRKENLEALVMSGSN
jgi:cell division septation protein DedD